MTGEPDARQSIHARWDAETIQFFDVQRTHITSYPRLAAGTKIVGNGKPPKFTAKQPTDVTDVLIHKPSTMS
jgi:hypothetical protein